MRHTKHFDKNLYNRWHRRFDNIAMVDIDQVECCQVKGCWQPLALVETAYDTGNYYKTTTITKWLGEKANIPVWLVFYKEAENMMPGSLTFKVRQIYPIYSDLKAISEAEWVSYLRNLQHKHYLEKHCDKKDEIRTTYSVSNKDIK